MTLSLSTERLAIEPLNTQDLIAFVRYRQQPEVARFQTWETNYSLNQGQALLESQASVSFPAPGDWLQLAIRSKASGELLGDLALHSLEEPGHFEVGFTLATENQGQGIAYEAASALLDYLIDSHSAVRVIANTDSRNEPSQRLLRKLGFALRAELGWVEQFKGETVRVEFFELLVSSKDSLSG